MAASLLLKADSHCNAAEMILKQPEKQSTLSCMPHISLVA
jgi:hypothetical protein